jgi:cysteine desulfurase/selenocysteine lyase
MFMPTGIGGLYGKRSRLDSMRPYQGGGDMIAHVSFDGTTYKEPPSRFEAGTPHIAGGIGLAAGIDYIESIGRDLIHDYETQLIDYAAKRLRSTAGVRLIGEPTHRSGAISFVMESAHAHDIGTILDTEGIAVRSGHHCCEPLMKRFGISATARASIALYNNHEDIDALVASLGKVHQLFG